MNPRKWKVLVSFWVFGLCNNFAYVIMLSAAHDILAEESDNNDNSSSSSATTPSPPSGNHSSFHCNPTSTGAVLLADILPTLAIKLSAPFFIQSIPYGIRIGFVALFSAGSFVIVHFSSAIWMSLLGVACASISSGAGEITFLSFTAFYDKDSVSTWSSGTGGAGLFGALAYAGLTALGLSPRNTLLVMLIIPVAMVLSYWFVLPSPSQTADDQTAPLIHERAFEDETTYRSIGEGAPSVNTTVDVSSWHAKWLLVRPLLLKYMLPLVLVYLAEYFINQGLFELIYFNISLITQKEQYRWYQVTYQLGVFISRSSVNLFTITHLWLLPILQMGNVVIFSTQVWFEYIPWIWAVFALIFWEGLLGGAAYVNTFYQISKAVDNEKQREFSMGAASISDSVGVAIAGATSLPVHSWLCRIKGG